MRTITLIGFDQVTTRRLAADLAVEKCNVISKNRASEIPPEALALLVCGDDPEWAITVRRARAQRPDIRVVVVTRLPDTAKWLDALEAGAHDYCGMPFDRHLVTWLLGRDIQLLEEHPMSGSSVAAVRSAGQHF